MEIKKSACVPTKEELDRHDLIPGENFFVLDDGSFLVIRKKKYESRLTFLFRDLESLKYEVFDKGTLNAHIDGSATVMRGEYFVSKKGTDCFRIMPGGKHMLLRVDWGGAFNTSRGIRDETLIKKALYYYRASSNGGGTGYDYIVLPADTKNAMSEDDI